MPKSKQTYLASVAAATGLLVNACTVGPDYQRPTLEMPTAYSEDPNWKRANPDRPTLPSTWWEGYADPELDRLEQRIDNNASLAEAEALYREAVAITDNARAALFPKITASAAYNRFVSPTGQNQVIPGIRQTFNTAVSAAWELDLWGRIRRQVEAGEASAAASASVQRGLRLSLQAQLAQDYFQLRTLEAQKDAITANVENYAKTVELTRYRYEAGVVGKADLVQAQTQLTATKARAVDLEVQRAALEHGIAVLIGVPPENLKLAPSSALITLPAIPPAAPSQLLERRPDVVAAEEQMIAANAQIGAAKAAFFPNVTLNFNNGFQNSRIDRLLTTASHYFALGPAAAALPLFEGGARNAQLNQAKAAHQATAAAYRQTVLTSFKEVEDNLAAQRILETEAQILRETVETGREAVRLTTNQYKAGAVSFQSVLIAQAAVLENEVAYINVHGRRLDATVGLIKALGGGWDATQEDKTRKPEDDGINWRHYLPFPES